jgi:hypothetical protein
LFNAYIVQTLGFKLFTKQLTRFIFFSSSPAYTTRQLKPTYKKVKLPVEIKTSSTNDKHSIFSSGILETGKDTVYLTIANSNSEPHHL